MMTGTEIWVLEDEWMEVQKVCEFLCTAVTGVPMTSMNDACVKELGRTDRKEKVLVLERIMKHCLRLLET
jgi:hypothetical protein